MNFYAFPILFILAQETQDTTKSLVSTLILLPIMFLMMYFLVIRPQRKEEEDKKKMIDSLQKGDSVVTSGGIHGKIIEFRDNNETVVINIAKDTNVTFNSNVISKKKVS
ncbi:MAG: preprotein translocase subunit YajC [Spirochaetia bacterium]|nr:preprotein translocase subunit YajC [Spirochaetia bacterium]